MKKDLAMIISSIWMMMVLLGLILEKCTGGISTDTYYLGIIGAGIWLALLNLYIKE